MQNNTQGTFLIMTLDESVLEGDDDDDVYDDIDDDYDDIILKIDDDGGTFLIMTLDKAEEVEDGGQ